MEVGVQRNEQMHKAASRLQERIESMYSGLLNEHPRNAELHGIWHLSPIAEKPIMVFLSVGD